MAWALADFSGYLAADELYEGPFCVLSIVDNRTFKRLFFQVLDHAPMQDDVIVFSSRFQHALQARHLSVRGITTDGWSAAHIEEEIVVTETGNEIITGFPANDLMVAGHHYYTATGPCRRRARTSQSQARAWRRC